MANVVVGTSLAAYSVLFWGRTFFGESMNDALLSFSLVLSRQEVGGCSVMPHALFSALEVSSGLNARFVRHDGEWLR